MNRREIEKLLGGYATGTLTQEEREALFAAALENQDLFDALAREQPLRELLAEPGARARLLAALDEARPGFAARLAAWIQRPQVMAPAATAAVLLIAVALIVARGSIPERGKPVEMAAIVEAPAPLPPAQEAMKEAAPPPRPAPARKVAAPPAPAVPEPLPPPPPAKAAPPAPPAPAQLQAFGGAIQADAAGVELVRPESAPPERPNFRAAASAETTPERRLRTMVGLVRNQAPPPLRHAIIGRIEAGEPVRLQFESHESGWLYVFEILPAGWRLIGATKIEAGKPAAVPLQFDQPGHKELLAVISRVEQTDLRAGDIAVPPAAVASRRIALEIPRP